MENFVPFPSSINNGLENYIEGHISGPQIPSRASPKELNQFSTNETPV